MSSDPLEESTILESLLPPKRNLPVLFGVNTGVYGVLGAAIGGAMGYFSKQILFSHQAVPAIAGRYNAFVLGSVGAAFGLGKAWGEAKAQHAYTPAREAIEDAELMLVEMTDEEIKSLVSFDPKHTVYEGRMQEQEHTLAA